MFLMCIRCVFTQAFAHSNCKQHVHWFSVGVNKFTTLQTFPFLVNLHCLIHHILLDSRHSLIKLYLFMKFNNLLQLFLTHII